MQKSLMPIDQRYTPSTAHAKLGPRFYDPVTPAIFPAHIIRWRNDAAAQKLGLVDMDDQQWIAHFARFEPLPDNHPTPLALRYHGHQFRHYNADLGDGRGFLFAQLYDSDDQKLLDLGTKGSGQTPWSRFGDGRLTLKGGVREILATEMLEALGVNTSKTFSLIETGEQLTRHDEPSPTRAAVLVRLSHSHIRIGTFQRLAYEHDHDAIARLIDHIITYYMRDLAGLPPDQQRLAFYQRTIENTARTCGQWMAAGFVHGVLNTDNINITGESFDYGPWRFLPHFDVDFTAAYFDENGLYAYGRQPQAVKWNLARLAECLLPLCAEPQLTQALSRFDDELKTAYSAALLRQLGLAPAHPHAHAQLSTAWMEFLHRSKINFAQAHFDWYGGLARSQHARLSPCAAAYAHDDFNAVRQALKPFEPLPHNADANDYFARPTPHTLLIDDVENIWAPIWRDDDWSAFDAKIAAINVMKRAYAGADHTAADQH
jgi:uncharacterized protein YdiU (UPF0061 family)